MSFSRTTFEMIPPTIITWSKNTNTIVFNDKIFTFHSWSMFFCKTLHYMLDLGGQCLICHTTCSQVLSHTSPTLCMMIIIPQLGAIMARRPSSCDLMLILVEVMSIHVNIFREPLHVIVNL